MKISNEDMARTLYSFYNGYNLENILDEYWSIILKEEMIPAINKIYDLLVRSKYTQDKYHSYNDADNKAFYLKAKAKRKVFAIESYNRNFLFISEENKYGDIFHIRKFYKKWEHDEERFPKSEILNDPKSLIKFADSVTHHSDDISTYSSRPSLDYFKKINFDLNWEATKGTTCVSYGDLRDYGYIASLGHMHSKLKGCLGTWEYLKFLHEIELDCLYDSLNER